MSLVVRRAPSNIYIHIHSESGEDLAPSNINVHIHIHKEGERDLAPSTIHIHIHRED